MALRFQTTFVPEAARTILRSSLECTYEDLTTIAVTQAEWTQRQVATANKLLFCDTGLLTTQVYAQYLFGRVPAFEPWIVEANRYDFYLFLDSDVPYVQDGTRLGATTRPPLREAFWLALQNARVDYAIITGSWEARFGKAVKAVEERFGPETGGSDLPPFPPVAK